MRARGNSLLETVIALFVLVSAALVVVALYHSALQRTTRTRQGALARLIAERTLAQVRAEAAEKPFRVVEPSTLSRTFPDPESPDFTVTATVERTSLTNPASSLQRPGTPQIFPIMTDVASVEILVRWGVGEEFRLNSLLDEGEAPLASVTVVAPPGLAGNQEGACTARAFDINGQEIPDVRFIWWVDAGTGNATVTADPLDNTAKLKNITRGYDGVFYVQPGTCQVAALARVRGKEFVGYSGEITLGP